MMSMSLEKIREAIFNLFNAPDHPRVVFWHDRDGDFEEEFEQLEIPDCIKVCPDDNEFLLKYRILKEQPDARFLIYRKGPLPTDPENWLLDLELASPVFSASVENILCSELGLSNTFLTVIREHLPFFKSEKRKKHLMALIHDDETPESLKMKMLMICCDVSPVTDHVDKALLKLLDEHTRNVHTRYELIERCHLKDFLWTITENQLFFKARNPDIYQFAHYIFQSLYDYILEEKDCPPNVLVFANNWKDSSSNRHSYEALSDIQGEIMFLHWESKTNDYLFLQDYDYFREFEHLVFLSLADNVKIFHKRADEIINVVNRRKTSIWYAEYEQDYLALQSASQFFTHFEQLSLDLYSAESFLEAYEGSWYLCDLYYRRFVASYLKAPHQDDMKEIYDEIQGVYANEFLFEFNNAFQKELSKKDRWHFEGITRQRDFYTDHVKEKITGRKKVAVIISDAMRYEVAHELRTLIQSENRYEAKLEAMCSSLPSQTALGMASLLPHQTLEWTVSEASGEFVVMADDTPTSGTDNRQKILQREVSQSICLKSREVVNKGTFELRESIGESEVVYCYHNEIDKTGDSRESETNTFDACDRAISEVFELIKKFANANFTNFIVTADHGFLYTHGTVETSDFTETKAKGEQIIKENPRYVIGKGLQPHDAFMHFRAEQLDIKGSFEVLIPKSINRIRHKGSGQRYVHGGASLQEIVVPVLTVIKKRKDDVKKVDIAILSTESEFITTGMLSISLYQEHPCSEKIQPRHLKIGLYTQSGELVSDSYEYLFDSTSENINDRERFVDLRLTTKAQAYNNQTLYLKLTEKYKDSDYFEEYKRKEYKLRMTFGLDF